MQLIACPVFFYFTFQDREKIIGTHYPIEVRIYYEYTNYEGA
jgi:hypothetical protein